MARRSGYNQLAADAELGRKVRELVKGKPKAAPKPRKSKKAKGREKLTDAEKAIYAAKNDADCIAAFTKAGYKDVQPRVNVLTYGKVKEDGSKTGWLSMGRQVKKGQKAVRVGPFALFHIDQTEEIPLADQPAANAVAA